MKTGIFLWQFDKDYPAELPADDKQMPMSFAFPKVNDGLNFMGQFDTSPAAVADLTGVGRVRDMYKEQGIGFVPWGVIHGGAQAAAEGTFAGQIASQCGGLYMIDLEPYAGFWSGGDAEVDAFMVAFLNAGGREAWLCPDTRQADLGPIDLARWLNYSQVTRVWPQAYWTDFEQGWEQGLHSSLDPLAAFGLPKERVWPVLPANAFPGDELGAVNYLEAQGYPGFALWRRGTLTPSVVGVLNGAVEYNVETPVLGMTTAPTSPAPPTAAPADPPRTYEEGYEDAKARAIDAINAL